MYKLSPIFFLTVLLISCASPSPRKPISVKSSSFMKESIERNKLINQQEEEAFKYLMEQDSSRVYHISEHGFWYTYEIENTTDTIHPKRGDEITYRYEIKTIDQEVLYSEEELGLRNYLVDKQELIKGLQNGLKLMKQGEVVTFLFPSHLAYGYAGYKNIGSNQPLIYTVTLETIKQNNE
ncbi:gliding motility-associated peptidyl-prolyl isomerase GldI [Flavobacteriaceae bacterium F08102]|nr:gliding motility-associated peptidyl-prolyl isomerase GldI [Flavobacteriaceae bacterium F08102]